MFKKVSIFTRNNIYRNLIRFQSHHQTTYRRGTLTSFGVNNNNNNNFSFENKNKFYSTLNNNNNNTTTTTNHKKNIDLSESNISNNLAEIKKLEILSKVPKPIEEFKDELLNCDPKELNNNQRLLSSSFLWKYLGITNSSPNTLGKKELNKIWTFLDIKNIENKQEKEAIEIQQLIICLHSRYLIDKVIPLMDDIINNRDINTLSEKMIIQCFLISPHLSRWQDMIKYGKMISPQIFEQLNAEPYYSHEFFPYKKIYELLNNNNNNIINQDNNNNNNNKSFIQPWAQYNVHSLGFKNNKIMGENISEEVFKTAEKNYYDEMNLLKSKIMDQDEYIIANLGEIKYCLMFGGAVKLYLQMGGPPMVCGGVLKDNSIQLYGSSHFEDEFNNSVEIISEYNLNIVNNNNNNNNSSNNIDDAISLIGTHKQTVSNLNTSNGNNEKYIYTMDIKINILKE
ncbi:hypothetical protein ACTFIW_008838 [Dictyostelium discoideum]